MKKHALAVLIDEVEAEHEWSDQDVADRAALRNRKISKQTISRMRNESPLKTLVPGALMALADGLELPIERVVEAALPSAGLHVGHPSDWSVESAVRTDPGLPAAAKRMLLALLREAREAGVGNAEHPATTKTAADDAANDNVRHLGHANHDTWDGVERRKAADPKRPGKGKDRRSH